MIFGLDTEDRQGWPACYALSGRRHKKVYLTGPEPQDELIGFLSRQAELEPVMVWALNLQYDLVNLFGSDLPEFCQIFLGRKKITGARLLGSKVRFFAVEAVYPRLSAEQIGRELGVRKIKFDFEADYDRADLLSSYCLRDAEIARRAGEKAVAVLDKLDIFL